MVVLNTVLSAAALARDKSYQDLVNKIISTVLRYLTQAGNVPISNKNFQNEYYGM
jgi:hypothetical protein